MDFLADGMKCNIVGWGSINPSMDYSYFDSKLKEIAYQPVMKFKRCTMRLFFNHLKEQGPYSKNDILSQVKDEDEDVFDIVRKFNFCLSLKRGCPRGPGRVRFFLEYRLGHQNLYSSFSKHSKKVVKISVPHPVFDNVPLDSFIH